jgi:hypothetical protein
MNNMSRHTISYDVRDSLCRHAVLLECKTLIQLCWRSNTTVNNASDSIGMLENRKFNEKRRLNLDDDPKV